LIEDPANIGRVFFMMVIKKALWFHSWMVFFLSVMRSWTAVPFMYNYNVFEAIVNGKAMQMALLLVLLIMLS